MMPDLNKIIIYHLPHDDACLKMASNLNYRPINGAPWMNAAVSRWNRN